MGRYATKLNSFEINWEHPLTDQIAFLAGFRAVELDDDLTYHLNMNTAAGDYGYRNHLYGGQFGGDWALTRRGNPLQIDIVGKAGIYGNADDGGVSLSENNHLIEAITGASSTAAFVGEIDFTAAYILSPHWAIRGGYQLLWLDNLALASDAASRSLFNPTLLRTVGDQGHTFYNPPRCRSISSGKRSPIDACRDCGRLQDCGRQPDHSTDRRGACPRTGRGKKMLAAKGVGSRFRPLDDPQREPASWRNRLPTPLPPRSQALPGTALPSRLRLVVMASD